jgi:hypothetical protein
MLTHFIVSKDCYMRDSDGHLIEVGQLVGRAGG